MHELYTRADPHFTGRATVPVLWDKQAGTIVNNESADIVRMLNSGFGALADDDYDLYPAELASRIDALNDRIYPALNNGVYRAGFATTQVAYEEAFADVFAMLDELEEHLSNTGPCLFDDSLTETDIRLFVTLVRFDAAYYGAVQVQSAPHRRLSQPQRPCRPSAGCSWHPRHRQHRSHQARLLLHQGPQPHADRSDRPRPAGVRSRRSGPHGKQGKPPMNSLVIFLHGVGSRGADLAPLGHAWQALLPEASFVAPDAPQPFDRGGPGRQWFSVSGVTEANRPQRIVAAREAFDGTLWPIIRQAGFTDRLERVALVGFSQGAIMALDALASGRWPVAAVVAFAGRLASPEPLAPATVTKALLVHGTRDQVMPVVESERAMTRLAKAGVTIELHLSPGEGHTVSAEGAAIAGSFLRGALEA